MKFMVKTVSQNFLAVTKAKSPKTCLLPNSHHCTFSRKYLWKCTRILRGSGYGYACGSWNLKLIHTPPVSVT